MGITQIQQESEINQLKDILKIWENEPDSAMFGATIDDCGGPNVNVRLSKGAAITALKDVIKDLEEIKNGRQYPKNSRILLG